jgi:hypothetical protein
MVMRTAEGQKEGGSLDGGALTPPRAWSSTSTNGGKTWSIAQEEPDLYNSVSEAWFGQSRTGTQLYVYNDGPAFSRMALRHKVKPANGTWSDEHTFFDAGIHNSYPTLTLLTALLLVPMAALQAAEPVSLSADHAAAVDRQRRIFFQYDPAADLQRPGGFGAEMDAVMG